MEAISSLVVTSASTKVESRLIVAQAIAGILFLVFLALHLSNTFLAVFGPEIYNDYQRAVRQIYQHPLLELLLVIGPLITHVIAGLWLYRIRKSRRLRRALRYRLQSWAGFFLLLVVFGHVLATRGISYWYGVFAEFEGVSFSLWWVPAYFYPYYFLLFMAGLYHGSMGLLGVLKRFGFMRGRVRSNYFPALVTGLGAVGAILVLLAFGGFLFEIDDPRNNDYARQYSEWMDVELTGPRQ
ncbi:MAG: hypothetical protein AB8B81_00710 [Halioglobus sp.]